MSRSSNEVTAGYPMKSTSDSLGEILNNRILVLGITGFMMIAILIAYLIVRDTRATGNEIRESYLAAHEECRTIFQIRIQNEIITGARPLEKKDLQRINRDFERFDPEDCRKMVEQMTMQSQ